MEIKFSYAQRKTAETDGKIRYAVDKKYYQNPSLTL